MRTGFEELSDETLAAQCQAGSADAFEELVTRYERPVFAFAVRACGSESDALDIAQETFLRAYRAVDKFDCAQSFRIWLFAIARRKCVDHFRARGRGITMEIPDQEDQGPDPAESLARHDDAHSLWSRAQRVLPRAQFEALWLRYVESMEVAEISRVLRKTNTHVKVLLFRARRALVRELDHCRTEVQGRPNPPAPSPPTVALQAKGQR